MANVLQIIRNKKILSFLQCYYKKLRKISSKLPYSESFLPRLFTQYILLFVHCQSYQIPPTHSHCHFIQLGIELSHCSVSKLKSNRSSYCGTFNSNTYIGILFHHSSAVQEPRYLDNI